jgi:hypothetical protein
VFLNRLVCTLVDGVLAHPTFSQAPSRKWVVTIDLGGPIAPGSAPVDRLWPLLRFAGVEPHRFWTAVGWEVATWLRVAIAPSSIGVASLRLDQSVGVAHLGLNGVASIVGSIQSQCVEILGGSVVTIPLQGQPPAVVITVPAVLVSSTALSIKPASPEFGSRILNHVLGPLLLLSHSPSAPSLPSSHFLTRSRQTSKFASPSSMRVLEQTGGLLFGFPGAEAGVITPTGRGAGFLADAGESANRLGTPAWSLPPAGAAHMGTTGNRASTSMLLADIHRSVSEAELPPDPTAIAPVPRHRSHSDSSLRAPPHSAQLAPMTPEALVAEAYAVGPRLKETVSGENPLESAFVDGSTVRYSSGGGIVTEAGYVGGESRVLFPTASLAGTPLASTQREWPGPEPLSLDTILEGKDMDSAAIPNASPDVVASAPLAPAADKSGGGSGWDRDSDVEVKNDTSAPPSAKRRKVAQKGASKAVRRYVYCTALQ